MADNWDDYYTGAAEQYNVDPKLLRAIVSVESGGNPNAVSNQGAVGATQLMPATASSLGVTDSTDPKQSIYGAAKLLDENIKRYGDSNKAVLAYHGGTDEKNWGPKTEDYLAKVMQAYQSGASGNPSAPSQSDEDLLNKWANKDSSATVSPDDQKLLDQWSNAGAPAAVNPAAAPQASGVPSGMSTAGQVGEGFIHGLKSLPYSMARGGAAIEDYLVKNNLINPPSELATSLRNQLGLQPNQITAANADYENKFGQSTPALVGNILGGTAVTLPALAMGGEVPIIGEGLNAMRAGGFGARTAANALTGVGQGLGGAAMLSGGNNESIGNQLTAGGIIGGALGPLAPYVGKVGGAVARMFMKNPEAAAVGAETASANGVPELLQRHGVDYAALPPNVQKSVATEASAQIANDALNPASLARKANMEELDLTTTNGILSRDPIQWAKEQEAAKQGGALTKIFENNNSILRNHLADVSKNSGGLTSTAEDAGDSAVNAVTSKFKEYQGDVSNAYKAAEKELGPDPIVHLEGLMNDLGPLSDKTAGIPIVDAIKARLGRYGVLDKNGNLMGKLSVGNSEELRKFISEEATNDPATNRIVRNLVNTLDGDVQTSTGSDAFGQARQLAAKRFGEIDSSKITSDVMDGKVNPAQFVSKYVVGKATPSEDLQAFKDTLTSGSPEQIARGIQALNDLKQQTAHWIQSQATNGNLEEGQISYPGLKKALEAIGPKKLSIIFGDDGAAQYGKILRAAHDSSYKPGLAPVNTSNTGNALINAAKGAAIHGATMVPGVGPVVRMGLGAMQLGKQAIAEKEAEQFTRNALSGTKMPKSGGDSVNPLYGAGIIPGATNYLLQSPQSQALGNKAP